MSSPSTWQTVITALATVISASIVGYVGTSINAAIATKGQDIQLLELAIGVLHQDPKASEPLPGLREWATDVVSLTSQRAIGIPLPKEAREELTGGAALPLPVNTAIPEGGSLLTLTTEPEGAEVYLNDMLIGHTPMRATQPSGSYRVRLVLGDESFESVVGLYPGKEVEVRARFKGASGTGSP